MPAYARYNISEFASQSVEAIVGCLNAAYARDGFATQYTRQMKAWEVATPQLMSACKELLAARPDAAGWTVLLEYPLHRLRRRIDVVLLAGATLIVIECKVGASTFLAADRRQVEEYALDLRDFHAQSRDRTIVPVLWSTAASGGSGSVIPVSGESASVHQVIEVGIHGLVPTLASIKNRSTDDLIDADKWDRSLYRPVPSVIEAATAIFAGHNVRQIANAEAENLRSASATILQLIQQARAQKKRFLVVLTGVPGSGKTLAGLDVVHSAVATGLESEGDIVYLSGNTPLVVVLREALARDDYRRLRRTAERAGLSATRLKVRARIQHIIDFLRESLSGRPGPPHEHVIVFDEAQRAWDAKHGFEKFERTSSEPALLLEIMSRHRDWCACICLVGVGQEINSGEEGLAGWGHALRSMGAEQHHRWSVFGPAKVFEAGTDRRMLSSLGTLPPEMHVQVDAALELVVPQRSFRSPSVSAWVDAVLEGDRREAKRISTQLGEYPMPLTRTLNTAKRWLRSQDRGERRIGLLASSGARRLRADGLGTTLHAKSGSEIAHWYLNDRGDIRSSYALEVPANEYTCQGLEIDFGCICWGGDLLWNEVTESWQISRLLGTTWQRVRAREAQMFAINSYRVLMTRAREGLTIWVPEGDVCDETRCPRGLDATASFLISCGASTCIYGT